VGRLGVPVINQARCIERSVDKYFTSTLLEDAGIPTPRTRVCERFDDAMAAFDDLGRDVVLKPLFGSEGRGMVRLSDADLAYRTFRALEVTRSVFYLQEFVPHGGPVIRAFVMGGRVVAGMVRRGPGGRLELPAGLAALSRRAAALLEADYAGVDLLRTEDGRPFVIEVNGIPGWHGIQRTTSVDIAGAIADHVLTAARRSSDEALRR